MKKRQLKPYVALILIGLYAVDIFWLNGRIVEWMGTYGILFYEGLLVVIAAVTALVFRADLRKVFPFKRPRAARTAGTLLLWLGCFFTAMLPTAILMYVFPGQVMEASQGVGEVVYSLPFLASMLLIAATPAVCEEMAFRGGLLSSLRSWGKWPAVLLTAAIFGAFHGSLWRFVPTAILGIGLGYVLVETDNMFYNMLFHLVNNTLPIALMQGLSLLYEKLGIPLDMETQFAGAMQVPEIPLASVAVYFLYGSGAPLLIYAGVYLLHKGQPGWQDGFFPRRKNRLLIALLAVCGGLFLFGTLLFLLSMFLMRGQMMGF